MKNYMKLTFPSDSVNQSFARSAVASFILPLNPTLSELSDVKTAVSEAVTNCMVHAYRHTTGEITLECETFGNVLHIRISDTGVGIENVELATTPFYTTLDDEERSGMGFTIMQTFTDELKVTSAKGQGTTVYMTKIFTDGQTDAE